jgi:putative MATE family efflux protein
MRALGETKIPGLLMVGSSVMNIVLDPLLIFGWGPFPGMGVLGAALASVIADMVFVVLSFWVLLKRLHLFTLKGLRVQEGVMAIQSFIKIGFPASLANMIVPFSIGVVTYLVASYGEAAVAAFGVVTRVETFFLVLPLALSSVLGPFVGQHVGAERYDRIHEALRLVFRFCLLWGLLLAVILFFLSSIIMEAFNSDPNVVRQGRFYFWIVPISYMGYSIVMNVSAAFNAFGRPKPTLILSLLRMVVLYLPLAYFLQQFWGLVGIFVAASFANMISGCVAYYWNRVHCSGSS